MPEIVVSGLAAWEGQAGISLGNVLGSNVANIGLVLGACAVVLPRVLEARLALREASWLFLSLAALWWVTSDRAIGRGDALLLLAVFAAYNLHLLLTAQRREVPPEVHEAQAAQTPASGRPAVRAGIGILAVALGARLVVDGASAGALRMGVPVSVVGLTVVAVGTSLPELAAGLGGALRGESDISIGNVVGSNVFNLLAVIGIVGVLQPLDPEHFPRERAAELDAAFGSALDEDLWVVLAFSLAAVFLPWTGRRLSGRARGTALLALYGAYVAWLFATRQG
jgi:cation:H+ antiporter